MEDIVIEGLDTHADPVHTDPAKAVKIGLSVLHYIIRIDLDGEFLKGVLIFFAEYGFQE